MSRQKRNSIIFGISGITIIALVISFSYSAEQTRIKGFTFGNELQRIQEDLKQIQTDFEAEMNILNEGESTNEEFSEYSKNHISEMEKIIARYDNLDPPSAFAPSVDLFKLSTQSQLESDKEMIDWIEHGNEDARIRSSELLKDAFDYEMAALAKFNAAKAGIDP